MSFNELRGHLVITKFIMSAAGEVGTELSRNMPWHQNRMAYPSYEEVQSDVENIRK